MKRGKTLIHLFVLLLIPLASSVEITLSKDSYQPQETLQAEITGNFLSLTQDNVVIYTDEKAHPEPTIKGLVKYGNIYYFYAILPNQEEDFFLRIENVEYLQRGRIISETINKNFTTAYTNNSDLSINPGFIISTEDDDNFEIKVKSLYKNVNINAVFEATGEIKNLNLIEDIESKIKFSLPKNLEPQKSKITIGNYNLPVFLLKQANKTVSEIKLEFIPEELKGTILLNTANSFSVIIKNIGKENLTNIEISSDLNISISPKNISILEPGENKIKFINLSFPVVKTEEDISGKLTAKAGNTFFEFPIFFDITTNQSDVKIDDSSTTTKPTSYHCIEELGGAICTNKQKCDVEEVPSLEGSCCIGDCIKKNSGNKNLIGGILIVLLILIIIYIIFKFKQKQKLKSPSDILKERSGRYQERINPKIENKEVSRSLDKV